MTQWLMSNEQSNNLQTHRSFDPDKTTTVE